MNELQGKVVLVTGIGVGLRWARQHSYHKNYHAIRVYRPSGH